MGSRVTTPFGGLFRKVAQKLPIQISARIPRKPLYLDPTRSSLSTRDLRTIQTGSFRYEYEGMECLKNPFDLALYMMLMSRERPRTIVEIGSYQGGSAIWLAAQARALNLQAHIYSLDLDAVTGVSDDDITFLGGDIHDLESSDLPRLLADCPRPLLVIEDGPHTFRGCSAALDFFHPLMRAGEFLIVEDGILKDLRYWHLDDGPNRAIAAFLEEHPDDYRIADEYCHFYGHNVTWNTNGYLQRR